MIFIFQLGKKISGNLMMVSSLSLFNKQSVEWMSSSWTRKSDVSHAHADPERRGREYIVQNQTRGEKAHGQSHDKSDLVLKVSVQSIAPFESNEREGVRRYTEKKTSDHFEHLHPPYHTNEWSFNYIFAFDLLVVIYLHWKFQNFWYCRSRKTA